MEITKTTKNNTPFNGHVGIERIGRKANQVLIHETAFFRESDTNSFVQKYVKDMFSSEPEIDIVSACCSTGEEAVTLSMLFDKFVQKIKILGFDISKASIESAKSRRYKMTIVRSDYPYLHTKMKRSGGYSDTHLAFDSETPLTIREHQQKSLFYNFFEPDNITPPKEKITFSKRFQNWFERRIIGIEPSYIESKYFRLKPDKALNCSFVQGDVTDIDKIMKNKKAHVIYFRNALYHLVSKEIYTTGKREQKKEAPLIIRELFVKMKDCLYKNGILVFGEREHFQIENYDIVTDILKSLGFKELNKNLQRNGNVWQKQ